MNVVSRPSREAARWRWAACAVIALAACQEPVAPGDAGAPGERALAIQCKQDGGRILVDVTARDGSPPVSFTLAPVDGGFSLGWKTFEKVVHDAALPGSCAEASRLVELTYRGLATLERALAPADGDAPLDGWGCDTTIGPDWLRNVTTWLYQRVLPLDLSSCGPNGKCCDTHDICYADNHCSASSWARTAYCISQPNPWACFDACDWCNVNAGACFGNGTPAGQSSCCNPSCNICGQPRNPTNPVSGCVADCMCPNQWKCNRATGACEPGRADVCGNRICEAPYENCGNCPYDCTCSYPYTCVADACRPPQNPCGNGQCESFYGETCSSCPSDCRCNPNESCSNGACVSSGLCGGVGSYCDSWGASCCQGYQCDNAWHRCVDPRCPSGHYCDIESSYDCGDNLHFYCDYANNCCIPI